MRLKGGEKSLFSHPINMYNNCIFAYEFGIVLVLYNLFNNR